MHPGTSTRYLAVLLLAALLGGCQTDDPGTSIFPTADTVQPFPSDYRTEMLAFMHTYLNDPVGVRSAVIADPVQRTVGGRGRYVSCVRFAEREADGSYRDPREHAVVFVNGRLDRVADKTGDLCAGVAYQPFPALEQMTR